MKRGFSLLELLAALSVLGLLGFGLVPGMMQGWRQAEVREAARQLEADLQALRTSAQKGYNARFEWLDPQSYRLVAKQTQTRRLAPGLWLRFSTGGGPVEFWPPYGERTANGVVLQLGSQSTTYLRCLGVVGVTGKLVLRDGHNGGC